MLAYHLKRALRNAFARRFYAQRLERLTERIPGLGQAAPKATQATVVFVSQFYRHEYLDSIDQVIAGRFTFFGQSVDFGSVQAIDWHHTVSAEKDLHLWRMKLAHFGFVCPILVTGGSTHHQAIEELLTSFNSNCAFNVPGCFSSYWFPYSVSHRILSLLSGYLLARQTRALSPSFIATIERFIRRDVAFVLDTIEHELKNNHVERNLAALCLYYSQVDAVPPTIAARLNKAVRRIILDCVLEDGLLSERSAMYQGLTVMALRVFQDTPFLSDPTRKLAAQRLARAKHAWSVMSHPDGDIALFNDSWFGEVPPIATLIEPLPLQPLEVLPHAGYARLQDASCFVLFDAGAIGPYWNPGHGHADFLAVEIDIHAKRFIVDPGTYQYSTGERRRFERSAESHNGPGWHAVEPVAYSGCFKVGRMSEARLTGWGPVAGGNHVSGELCIGQSTASRSVTLRSSCLYISDRWRGDIPQSRTRILVPLDWKIESREANHLRFSQGEVVVDLTIRSGSLADVCESCWSTHYLTSRKAWLLTLEPDENAELDWEVSSPAQAFICSKEIHDVAHSS